MFVHYWLDKSELSGHNGLRPNGLHPLFRPEVLIYLANNVFDLVLYSYTNV